MKTQIGSVFNKLLMHPYCSCLVWTRACHWYTLHGFSTCLIWTWNSSIDFIPDIFIFDRNFLKISVTAPDVAQETGGTSAAAPSNPPPPNSYTFILLSNWYLPLNLHCPFPTCNHTDIITGHTVQTSNDVNNASKGPQNCTSCYIDEYQPTWISRILILSVAKQINCNRDNGDTIIIILSIVSRTKASEGSKCQARTTKSASARNVALRRTKTTSGERMAIRIETQCRIPIIYLNPHTHKHKHKHTAQSRRNTHFVN